MFSGIIGQDRAKSQVAAWLTTGRTPHAILIDGRPGVGKRAMALELAKIFNCESSQTDPCDTCSSCAKTTSLIQPNLHVLLPMPPPRARADEAQLLASVRTATLEYLAEDRAVARSNHNIPVDLIRAVQREMIRTPTEGPRRVCLIFEAERMHPGGANSLLKMLEEPPRYAVFILVSSATDRLLPTVVSRCQRLHLQPLSRDQLRTILMQSGVEGARAELGARFGEGSLPRAREVLSEEFDVWRQGVEQFISDAIEGQDSGYWKLLEEIDATRDRAQIEHFLHMCGLYLRDLFLMTTDGDGDVINVDRIDRLRAWAGTLLGGRIENAAAEAEMAYEHLERNVSPSLVLADLWRALRPAAAIPSR